MYTNPEQVLEKFSQGEFVIIVDEKKEKEGDFFVLAEKISAEKINFMLREARGMICVACSGTMLDRLKIPLMVETPEDRFGTNFTISVDAREEITTGVSAFDRAQTIQVLTNPNSQPNQLVRPGHTQPLRARDPKTRWGHTECSVQMAISAEKIPAVVICEILDKEGHKASKDQLLAIAKDHGFAISSLTEMKSFLLG